jgi:hypothetical protein
MRTVKNKEFKKRFLGIFTIEIYSEDRYGNFHNSEHCNQLYAHFISIYLLNNEVFHTSWRTGFSCLGKTDEGNFYQREI